MAMFIEKVINKLVKLDQEKTKGNTIHIDGPPSFVYNLITEMKRQGVSVDMSTGVLHMMSVWEDLSPLKFKAAVEKYLGIPGDRCMRHYVLSECCGSMVSCGIYDDGKEYYHIPSFLQAYVRDEEGNLYETGKGRFTFLDPLPTSYPGFIVTGDMVEILPECPDCRYGWDGPVITNIRRAILEEVEGCPVVMKLLGEVDNSKKNSGEKCDTSAQREVNIVRGKF